MSFSLLPHRSLPALIFLTLGLFLLPGVSDAAMLYRSLGYGMNGDDVRALQKFLSVTQTGYFGPLTRQAVIKFQETYASDILSPAGLMSGNGFVGPYTLKKLNSLDVSVSTLPDASPETRVLASERRDIYETDRKFQDISDDILARTNRALMSKGKLDLNLSTYKVATSTVFIRGISAQQGPSGTHLTLEGVNFDVWNAIYFGPDRILHTVLGSGSSISLTVPSLPIGRYDLAVSNSKGISNTVVFVVRDVSSPVVQIDTIEPQHPRFGDTITLHGSGFSTAGNDVITNYGSFKGLSSDGATISFKFTPSALSGLSSMGTIGKILHVETNVISQNGITTKPTLFDLAI